MSQRVKGLYLNARSFVCMCVCEFMYSQLTVNWSMRGEAPPLGTVKNEVVKCLQMCTSVCVRVCVCVKWLVNYTHEWRITENKCGAERTATISNPLKMTKI